MRYRIVIFSLLLSLVLVNNAFSASFALIVNKNNPAASISESDARQIYLGKKSAWDNGQPIVLYMQQSEELNREFSEVVTKKTSQQLQIYWKKALFTGTGRPPVEMKDDAEMKKFISVDPKGIGYISRSALDDSVKELKIR